MKAFIFFVTVALFSCSPKTTDTGSVQSVKTWLEIDPIQCMLNPWEKDWLLEHNNDYSGYSEEDESGIIKKYYQNKSIEILDIQSRKTHENVCEACDCPRGDTLYILVDQKDERKMIELGYRPSEFRG